MTCTLRIPVPRAFHPASHGLTALLARAYQYSVTRSLESCLRTLARSKRQPINLQLMP